MDWNRLRKYLRLTRIHSAVLTSLTPVVAAAAANASLPIYHYIQLFLIGLLFHFYIFIYNELRDISIDKTSEKLKEKPLIDGSVTVKNAKIIIVSSIILILILTIVFFQEKIIILIPISLLALLFAGLYDIFGKRFSHADYLLAASIFLLAIYGGFSVLQELTVIIYIICALAFMQVLIQNIIAGLKDVDHDYLIKCMSTPSRMGVKTEGKYILITKKFIAYISILKIIQIILLITPFVYSIITFESWQFLASLLLIIIALFFMIQFLTIKVFDREKIMRAIGFHEMFTFMVIPFILFSYTGIGGMLFLIFFPVIWLGVFLIILYGRLMPII
jgi:4-hydroxybenzoate polyprenyltransferase